MSTVLIVDGNPLAWRGSMMYKHLTHGCGTPTGCIYGALENFVRGVQTVGPDAVVVTWDSGKSRWRRELHPGYKIRRTADKTPEERAHRAGVMQQISIVQHIFSDAGVHQVIVPGVEADDTIGILASGFDCLDTYDNVVILGGDRDLYQLVRGVVTIYDPVKKVWIGEDYIKKNSEGMGPELITQWKALMGDSGDDVQGIDGVGEKRAGELLKKYGSIEALYQTENLKTLGKSKCKWADSVRASKDIVDKALKLVTITNCMHMEPLSDAERKGLADAIWTAPRMDRMSLAGSLDLYNLRRILDNVDTLTKPPPNFQGFEQWLSA